MTAPDCLGSRAVRRVLSATVAAAMMWVVVGCSDDGSDSAGEFCVFYRDFEASVAAAEAAPGSPEVIPDFDAIVADATAAAPTEVEEPWAVIVDSQNDFAEARARAGIDGDDPDQEAFESFDMTEELAAADRAVSEWVDQHCDPVNDL